MQFADRVKDTSTSTGTGNFTLSGSPATGFVSFNTAFGVGPTFDYVIASDTGSEWEIGTGTLLAATTLQRTTVLKSSNSDNLVNFSAGQKTVINTLTAVTYSADHTKLAGITGTNTGDQDLSGLMVKSANLSDVANAATARGNLSAAAATHTHSGADITTGTMNSSLVTVDGGLL